MIPLNHVANVGCISTNPSQSHVAVLPSRLTLFHVSKNKKDSPNVRASLCRISCNKCCTSLGRLSKPIRFRTFIHTLHHRMKRTINSLETNSEAIVAASSRLCALIAALIVLPSPSFHNSTHTRLCTYKAKPKNSRAAAHYLTPAPTPRAVTPLCHVTTSKIRGPNADISRNPEGPYDRRLVGTETSRKSHDPSQIPLLFITSSTQRTTR